MSIPINDELVPRTTGYKLIDDSNIAGSLHVVVNTTVRDAIPLYLLKLGMLVYTQADNNYWKCSDPTTTPPTFTQLNFAGGSGTVTSVGSGTGLLGGPIISTGTLSVDQGFSPTWTGTHTFSNQVVLGGAGNQLIGGKTTLDLGNGSTGTQTISFGNSGLSSDSVAYLAAAQTLTHKAMSGASNTFSNIANASLTNSSVTITAGSGLTNGGSVSLGGTVTLAMPNVGPGSGTIGGGSTYINSVTLDAQGRVTGATTAQGVASFSLTDAASITTDASQANMFIVTLAGNRALANPTNLVSGFTYRYIIKQDATGSRTLSYGTNFKFPSGVAPTLTTTANAVDMIAATYDGTFLRCIFTADFR